MKKYFCDCCKREIRYTEPRYSIEIKKGLDTEHILEDVCSDCYDHFNSIINNAERWRESS